MCLAGNGCWLDFKDNVFLMFFFLYILKLKLILAVSECRFSSQVKVIKSIHDFSSLFLVGFFLNIVRAICLRVRADSQYSHIHRFYHYYNTTTATLYSGLFVSGYGNSGGRGSFTYIESCKILVSRHILLFWWWINLTEFFCWVQACKGSISTFSSAI